VTRLDCHDVDSTLASLAGVARVDRTDLEQALREYDESRFDTYSEEPWTLMPREVLDRFGTNVQTIAESFEGAHYFHGTRTVDDPESFRQRGILPLAQMLDELWAMLRALAGDQISDEHWAAFRRSVETDAGDHDGFLYRHKVMGEVDAGPFGYVVRECLLDPEACSSHDYLGCPEIVQDICRCCDSTYGINLERCFCEASVACIVRFRVRTGEHGRDQRRPLVRLPGCPRRGTRDERELLL
jgi:hypothetical protein